MRMKRCSISFFILFIGCIVVNAQESTIPTVLTSRRTVSANRTDGVIRTPFNKKDLDKIVDLRSQFEQQNKTYSKPSSTPQGILRFLNKEKLQLSEEARYWINLERDASTQFDEHMTFRDTIIVNPLFMPLVFRGETIPDDLTFYDKDYLKNKGIKRPFETAEYPFIAEEIKKKIRTEASRNIRMNNPEYYAYTQKDMPDEVIRPIEIKKEIAETAPIIVEKEANFDDVKAPVKFIPERQYWQSGFESAIQFSQNYISKNWHKGGTSNMNLFTKNSLTYNYQKDKVQLTNRIEINTSVNNAPKDTLRSYKIGGDDLLRLQSTFGYKAYNNWFYTFDSEFRSAMFNSYTENSEQKQAAFLAPLQLNLGLGMKYGLNKQFARKDRKLALNVNVAPISFTYKYSRIKDGEVLDLGRHGFKKDPDTGLFENTLSTFGSTVKADFTVSFNKNVSWQSRLLYNTSYEKVEAEFENTLVMAISRFFSTRIYLYARYDDSSDKKDSDFGYFQINELLSFGFNYKW
ncbi:DUF3078 domain-containing protein [Parabacteroides sp. PF5-9]|uniref:DUF3078 domain-containing protein n=1 Tax=Parabacteroides sp. PF5-9 TaxID=1742404 RepID=UPI0024744127|nr:DUF3078 domain-containing protein [Parabacteroides sp. PF5-9]MDH6356152.1 hypothetical protein [Parabacteroides sp. PF5-9]